MNGQKKKRKVRSRRVSHNITILMSKNHFQSRVVPQNTTTGNNYNPQYTFDSNITITTSINYL